MDQFISSLGKVGHALLIDCRSLAYELVPLPAGASVLVVDTSAPRTLAGSAYNERRAQCEEGARSMGVGALRDVSVAEFAKHKAQLPELIAKRCEHVIHENQRTLDATAAMKAGDLRTLGALMNASHDSLRDLYAVSSHELDTVVNITRAVPGVYGARMTGAGFGGCAIALVANDAVEAARRAVLADYPRLTQREPKVYVCVASAGADWRVAAVAHPLQYGPHAYRHHRRVRFSWHQFDAPAAGGKPSRSPALISRRSTMKTAASASHS